MAGGTIHGSVGARGDSYSYYIDWVDEQMDISSNSSVVKAWVHISCSAHSAYQNNCAQNLYINGVHFTDTLNISLSAGVNVTLIYGETRVYHDADGRKKITISADGILPYGSGWGPSSGSASAEVWLDTIPRYATFNNYWINGIGLNSVDILYNSNKNLVAAEYSLNGGAWKTISVKSGTWNVANNAVIYMVSGLTPNTTYTIRTRIAHVNGLWTYTETISFSTKDIARISSIPNFEHGSNAVVTITNPATISSLSLVLKIGTVQIFSKTVKTGINTISFTDTELDNLYKRYENGSSLTATFIVSGGGYTNSKACTITLKRKSKDHQS